MSRPSVISRAHLVRYSWLRWIGFRVWKAATVLQPFSSNALRVWAGVRRYSANSGSCVVVVTSMSPARHMLPWPLTMATPGCFSSSVR